MAPKVKYCEVVERVQLVGLDNGSFKAHIIMKDGTRFDTKEFKVEDLFENKDDARVFFPKEEE